MDRKSSLLEKIWNPCNSSPIVRDVTERPEDVETGTLKVVGTDENTVYKSFLQLLSDHEAYARMSHAVSPYSDGHACERIVEVLLDSL